MKLTDITYCPLCGSTVTHASRYGRLRPVCSACGYIHFTDPKVAAAILVEQDGRVLLIQRANTPGQGLWSVPGGFVDADEDPARAAERECFEETGLSVRVTRLLDVVPDREFPNSADFVVYYAGEVLSGQTRAADDALAVEWFPRHALPPLAFKSVGYVLRNF
jgi:ADP-ribose pyrophosphatase YjhB (NUDIX family)